MVPIFQEGCVDPRARWNSLYSDAQLKLEQGELSSALSEADRGLNQSAGTDPIWNWKFRVLKAKILLWQTRGNEALQALAPGPPPELSTGEFAVRGKAIEGLASGYLFHDTDAKGRFKEAEELAAKTAPQLRSEVMLYEGDYEIKGQNFSLAEQHLRESLELARKYDQPFVESGAVGALGIALTHLGRFDEAIELLSNSLKLTQTHKYRLAESLALNNLAWSYEELGDLPKAVYYFAEAEKTISGLGQEKVIELIFMNEGDAYFDQGDYTAARDSYLQALSILQKIENDKRTEERSNIARAMDNLALVAIYQEKLPEADEYLSKASALDPHFPLTVLMSGMIAAAHHRTPEAVSALQELTATGERQSFVHWDPEAKSENRLIRWDAEAELANISAVEHQNSPAEHQFQSLIYEVEAARSALRVDENRLAFSFHAGRYYDDYVRFLIDTGQERKAFQVAEFSRARTLEEGVGMKAPGRPSDISISAVQNFLRLHNKTILAYWLARKKSYLWLVSASQFKTFTLVEESKIEPEVDSYNKILVNSGTVEDLEQVGQSLYRKLVAPAQGYLRHNAGVVIIPDGRLNQLNFETLRVPQPSPHYWIEDVEAQIADSTALLIRSKRDVWSRTPRLLVMGDPMEGGKPALPHGAEEIRRVEAHFPEDHEREVSGAGATPSAYKANHPEKYDLIHIVAHGSASELSPLESALILSSEGENSSKLYAREIVKTHLNADLVTISACGGAGKRAYSGEGLVGLAWAFLKAGAHRVVAGLWEVDDRAAVDLTDDFYTELQKRTPTSAALRAAKLKMVHSTRIYRLPYYWGSLQLYMGS